MMKKITVILLLSILTIATITPLVIGGNTDTINVTLNPQATADIEINQPSWSPSAALGGTEQTSASWATLSNVGQVQVDVTVKANNTAAWTLGSSAGHNQFYLAYLLLGTEQEFINQSTATDERESGWTGNNLDKYGQIFNVSEDIVLTSVEIIGRTQSSPGGTFELYNTHAGLPTGSPIATKSYACSNFPTGYGNEDWRTITLNTPVNLEADKKYAWAYYSGSQGDWNIFKIYGISSNVYANGSMVLQNEQGSWSVYEGGNWDLGMRINGKALVPTEIQISHNTFVEDLAYNENQQFGLKVEMPTSSSTNANQETEITFTATAD